MPRIIIVAGPNGAGKSTFIEQYLLTQRESYVSLNADEIERELGPQVPGGPPRQRLAARIMLSRIDDAIAGFRDLMIETTLATRRYAVRIPFWRSRGYAVGIVYLRLPAVDDAIDRVHRRVLAGGHDIPLDIIQRRFAKSLAYLDELYKPIVDEWYVFDSLEGEFKLAEAWSIP